MKLRYKDLAIYFLSIFLLLFFFYFAINYLSKKKIDIINFVDSELNKDFEIEITNNIKNINNFLKKFLFIESYILKKKENEINIQINLKTSFAINNITKEVIFYDNITAPINYFNSSYLDKINIIDISKNSIYINNYLNDNYQDLSTIFDIDKIEYIDDRRYNLILSSGKIVMLPKVIDSKLLYFIKNNIDLIEKSVNYEQFLDLRNFHKKTIRLK